MTLQAFVTRIRAGELMVPSSLIEGDTYATVMAPLTLDDPAAVTAEAFQHGVFNASESWERALSQVKAAIAGLANTRTKSDPRRSA